MCVGIIHQMSSDELANFLTSATDENAKKARRIIAHFARSYFYKYKSRNIRSPLSPEVIEDITQEFYIKLIESIAAKIRIINHDCAGGYLITCIKNFSYSYLRNSDKLGIKLQPFSEFGATHESIEVASKHDQPFDFHSRVKDIKSCLFIVESFLEEADKKNTSNKNEKISLVAVYLLRSRLSMLMNLARTLLNENSSGSTDLPSRFSEILKSDTKTPHELVLKFIKESVHFDGEREKLKIKNNMPTIKNQWERIEQEIKSAINKNQFNKSAIKNFLEIIKIDPNHWSRWVNRIRCVIKEAPHYMDSKTYEIYLPDWAL